MVATPLPGIPITPLKVFSTDLLLPEKILAARTDKYLSEKSGRNCIPVLICSNMESTDKWDLLAIGKAKKPRGFAEALFILVTYVSNTDAWMIRDIFSKWLADFDKEMVKVKCKVLLFLDNGHAHHINAHCSALEALFLPLKATAKLQKMDQGLSQTSRFTIGEGSSGMFWSTSALSTALST